MQEYRIYVIYLWHLIIYQSQSQGLQHNITQTLRNIMIMIQSCAKFTYYFSQWCSKFAHLQETTLLLSAQWPGLWMAARLEVTLFWYRPRCFCCVNKAVLMLTWCIYMRKAERSVSKQGHLQPRYHSEDRSLSRQL